ncbi:hypothetical protein FJY94_04660 [Candidatus Kaiserbacteria bacterium]|nr:hypothetical protein [Candidatus Kaiserbacteria bacterium]
MHPHTITSPPTRINTILNALAAEPIVRVAGYAYVVDMGRQVKPRLHTVHKDRSCNCDDSNCPAIAVVADWLKAGRVERAPDPPTGYTPFLPKACPMCGAKVFADHTLSSRRRGIGWQCVIGGAGHYWQHKWEAVKGWFFRDEILPGPSTVLRHCSGCSSGQAIKRGDLVAGAPMGYLPEANRCHVVPSCCQEMEGATP